MKYLTYEEYTQYGGMLTEAEFAPLEFTARKAIDVMTDCRVSAMAEVPEAVKMCMVSIMKVIGTTGIEAQAQSPVPTQFSTDGYSESYGHAMAPSESSTYVNKLICSQLYGELDDTGTPLLYRGVRTHETM